MITEALGFELEDIAALAHKLQVQIRVYPNVAQGARSELPGIYKFWIRPEDIEVYEDCVDVCEFFYDKYEKQQIFYEIYKKDKKWMGELGELIIGLPLGFNSMKIIPRFAYKRKRCGRQCLKGGKCRICHRVMELAETLEKTPIGIDFYQEREDFINGKRSNSESGDSKENIE